MTYCFLDIETTGLDPNKDEVLEVAWSFTDDTFTALDEGKTYLVQPSWDRAWNRINSNDIIKKMHTNSGLLAALANPDLLSYDMGEVWFDLRDDLDMHSTNGLIHLAGRSVHFDKSFLLANNFEDLFDDSQPVSFHHRMFDISAIKLFLDSVGIDSKQFDVVNEQPHRALADVQGDIGWATNAKQFVIDVLRGAM